MPDLSADQVSALLEHPNPVVDPTDRAAVTRVLARLAGDEMTLLGQLTDASNGVFLAVVGDLGAVPDPTAGAPDAPGGGGPGPTQRPPDPGAAAGAPWRVVYKPVRGERPLHDFPPATLARREVAAFAVSHEAGYAVVPPTVLRDGPLGPGSVQLWVDHDEDAPPMVDLVAPDEVPEGSVAVLAAETPEGEEVVVVHSAGADAARLAAYDLVVNNADRKGSHVLVDRTGRPWGIDHGITLHDEPRLRTVLWGWVGDPLPQVELERLALLASLLDDPTSTLMAGEGPQAGLVDLLSGREVEALRERVSRLLAAGTFPEPEPGHYPIPWPPL